MSVIQEGRAGIGARLRHDGGFRSSVQFLNDVVLDEIFFALNDAASE